MGFEHYRPFILFVSFSDYSGGVQLLGGLVHRLFLLGLCLGISSMCLFVTGTMIPNEVMYRGAQSSRLSFALFTTFCFDILWQQVCTFCHLASAQESCCRCID